MFKQHPFLLLFMKVFIYAAIGFPLLTWIGDYFAEDVESLNRYLFMGVLFGAFFASFIVLFTKFSMEGLGREVTVKDLDPHQEKWITTDMAPDEFVKKAARTLHAKIVKKGNYDYQLKIPWSLESFGERVDIHVSLEEDYYTYHVESSPVFPLTLVDYGKGLKNLTSIERLVW